MATITLEQLQKDLTDFAKSQDITGENLQKLREAANQYWASLKDGETIKSVADFLKTAQIGATQAGNDISATFQKFLADTHTGQTITGWANKVWDAAKGAPREGGTGNFVTDHKYAMFLGFGTVLSALLLKIPTWMALAAGAVAGIAGHFFGDKAAAAPAPKDETPAATPAGTKPTTEAGASPAQEQSTPLETFKQKTDAAMKRAREEFEKGGILPAEDAALKALTEIQKDTLKSAEKLAAAPSQEEQIKTRDKANADIEMRIVDLNQHFDKDSKSSENVEKYALAVVEKTANQFKSGLEAIALPKEPAAAASK